MADLKGGTTIGGYRAVHTNNIMTVLKARDGHTSGLDADLLDAREGEDYIYGINGTGCRQAENIDWIRKSGFYRPANATNRDGTTLPENTHSSILHIAHPTLENYFSQIAITYDRNDIYFRNKNYMGLSKWHKIYHEEFKPTPAAIGALGKTEKAVDSDKLRGWLLSESSTNYRGIPFVSYDGVMEVGKYIDFHLPGQNKDFDVRLEAGSDGMLYCYPGFVGNDFYANKYIRIRDWYGAATDGKLWFKGDGKIMATHEVNVFQCEKFKALGGGITSNGQIYAYQTDVVADKNVIFGGRAISTLQSEESNLFAEGRQSAHGYGWHFANLNGQYSDIYAKIYHQQSDARTKQEVKKSLSLLKDNETVLEKISKVNPKEFYYSEDISKKILYGFFAQDLESEFPIAVNTFNYSQEDIESGKIIFPKDKNGQDIHDLKSIDPVAISAIMWDALKEVYNSLEMQKIKNKELLDRIKALEEKIK